MAASSPGLTSAVQDAFMAGLQTSCVVVGVLCLVGAIVAVVALPGRIRGPVHVDGTGAAERELDAAGIA